MTVVIAPATSRSPRGAPASGVAGTRERIARLLVAVLSVMVVGSGCTGAPTDADAAPEVADTTVPTTAGPPPTVIGTRPDVELGPVWGGTLVYAASELPARSWAPHAADCARRCPVGWSVVTDTLAAVDDTGAVVPNLLETIAPNESFDVWTAEVRDGVRFHDGSAVDAAAVAYGIDTCRADPQAAADLAVISTIETSGLRLTFTLTGPSTGFPVLLAAGCAAPVFAPDWLASLADNPRRDPLNPLFDAATAARDPSGDPLRPVGAGPFVLAEPATAGSARAVRNTDYWRGGGPESTGEGLPYLDAVELVAEPDAAARRTGLASGRYDATLVASIGPADPGATDAAPSAAPAAGAADGDPGGAGAGSDADGDTGRQSVPVLASVHEIVPNVAARPADGTDAATTSPGRPLGELACRAALDLALDRARLVADGVGAATAVADGPFAVPASSDAPPAAFDPAAARAALDTCLAAIGQPVLDLELVSGTDAVTEALDRAVLAMWAEVHGERVTVSVRRVPPDELHTIAATGAFDSLSWLTAEPLHPSEVAGRWTSLGLAPLGSPGANIGRVADPALDEAFGALRTADGAGDDERAASATVTENIAANHWTIWTAWVEERLETGPAVHAVGRLALPSGGSSTATARAGTGFAHAWCAGGRCG